MIEVFLLWDNRDKIEGRGPMYVVGVYGTHDVAEYVGKSLPTDMGGRPNYRIEHAFVPETIEELQEADRKLQLDEAMRKLTHKELKLLREHFTRRGETDMHKIFDH